MARHSDRPRENPASPITGRPTPPSSPTDARRPRDARAGANDNARRDRDVNAALDEGLDETFPASDPVSATRRAARD